MAYIFKGHLAGMICDTCGEDLSHVKVRLYRMRKDVDVTALAVANPKNTLAILNDEDIQAKQAFLFAEAETDDHGDFVFELGDRERYDGGPFELDVYCATVPRRKAGHKPLPPPVQFTITTIQPLWKETDKGRIYAWDYVIPRRFWCGIRGRFNAWVICGVLTICGATTPLPGLRVRAFDTDWLQDDPLGSDITDASGQFRIDYLTEDFLKTPFSPLINIEMTAGPDVYFRIETPSGTVLHAEPSSAGRAAGRENVGHCFCVKLCLDKEQGQTPPTDPYPAFTSIGGLDFLVDIDSAPTGNGLTTSDKRAFFQTLRLNGILSKRLNGQPMEYQFEYAEYDPISNVLGAWKTVLPAQIVRTPIGKWEHYAPAFPGDPNPVKTKNYTVNGTVGPNELVAAWSPDGWIRVPQEGNFWTAEGLFSPNGNMINLVTQTLAAFGSKNLAGLVAGSSSVSTGQSLAADRYFALRMWCREIGNPASTVIGGTCQRIAVDDTLYDNMNHHPTWGAWPESSALCVHMIDIKELQSVGCKKITDQLNVLYTAAHPNMGDVTVWMTGPGGTYSFSLAGPVTSDTYGTAIPSGFTVVALPPCAYIVHLQVSLLLTTGDYNPDPLYDEMAFCK
jgi:hypothetical protein